MSGISVPTVHLNGTSKEELLLQVGIAAAAVHAAFHALQDAAPHGRDYYVQGGDALKKATEEHVSRLGRLQSVLDELKEIHEAVQAQVDAMESRKAT